MKKFFREFKEFISRGNILDLAVGMIIGAAFTAIVTALTANILQPLINFALVKILGGEGLEAAITMLSPAYTIVEGKEVIDLANSIYIDWGAFVAAIINFILIALVLFIIIKVLMRAKGASAPKYGQTITKEQYKAYRKQGKSKEEIAKIDAELTAAKKAEEEKAAAEAAANSTEALLKDIRDLLKNK
ncbi:MAG: large conductance mechanosensitive channel protein MscL [Clostridiales bacterium]|nr:large conductance mechanosensitive channel protein MscL [Clostridiales bacterium]